MLLHHRLDEAVRDAPEKIALGSRGERLTYSQLDKQVTVLAQLLQSRGIRRGDRVALFLENGFEMVVGMYAALRIGAVFVPVSPLTKREKLAYLLKDSAASALVTQASLRSAWEPGLAGNDAVLVTVVAGSAETLPARCQSFPSPDERFDAPGTEPATVDQDLASIVYTSGTTGRSKGVMLTHLNMDSAVGSVVAYLRPLESDVILCALPLAFTYGLYHVFMSVQVGATLILEQSFAFPAKVLQSLAKERATLFPGVPTIFATLTNMDGVGEHDLSALRIVTNAAAALTDENVRRLRALLPRAALYSMYGLSECHRVSYLPPELLDIRPGSVGRGMPNQEIWLVDDDGRRLPNGSTGELVIRGSHVMLGYWNRPEETAERLRPGRYPGERVLYSGDIFRTDEEGWLYFVARKDDIFKSRGEKVSPREVENVIGSLDGVVESAVVGVPDDVLGLAVKAFVVARQGHALTERDVIRHCLERLEGFLVPKHVQFVPELPKTDSGKIRRRDLPPE